MTTPVARETENLSVDGVSFVPMVAASLKCLLETPTMIVCQKNELDIQEQNECERRRCDVCCEAESCMISWIDFLRHKQIRNEGNTKRKKHQNWERIMNW